MISLSKIRKTITYDLHPEHNKANNKGRENINYSWYWSKTSLQIWYLWWETEIKESFKSLQHVYSNGHVQHCDFIYEVNTWELHSQVKKNYKTNSQQKPPTLVMSSRKFSVWGWTIFMDSLSCNWPRGHGLDMNHSTTSRNREQNAISFSLKINSLNILETEILKFSMLSKAGS